LYEKNIPIKQFYLLVLKTDVPTAYKQSVNSNSQNSFHRLHLSTQCS